MVVNEKKTELCLFHRNDSQLVSVRINDQTVYSKKSMNVLGVVFDCKLSWSEHVAHAIKKSNKSLCALRFLKKFFTSLEMKTLLTSNYYSSLYYNSEIWLSNSLKQELKQSLLSASANAIRSCIPLQNRFISFEAIHKNCNQFTPTQMGYYKLSILLHKLYNSATHCKDWRDLANQIVITRRQTRFRIFKSNNFKIGMNILSNRFFVLNDRIELNDLDLTLPCFKKKMKCLFK